MPVITALEIQKRNKERVNIYLDGEYAFSLTLMEAARLKKGQSFTEAELAALQDEDTVLRAVDSAARFLSYRPRSVAEVRRNLIDKEFAKPVAEAAIERLTTMGHLDDVAFTRFWVGSRGEFKPLSQRALRAELKKKGVPDSVVDEVLAEQDETELAYRAAQSQLRKLKGGALPDFKQKMLTFLQRRGFSYSTARTTLTRLIEELELRDEPFFVTTESDDD
jgi:regulatory protein